MWNTWDLKCDLLRPTQVVLLFMVALFRGCHFLLENPLGSIATGQNNSHHAVQLQTNRIWAVHLSNFDLLILATEIQLHERLAEFFRAWNVVECRTSLGMFGALSPKPTKLFSDDPWVNHMHRTPWCGY